MKLLAKILIHILANSAAILAASRILDGFSFKGNGWDLLIAGAIMGIANSCVKPVLKFLTFPIIFLTLGLFTVIINIILLLLVAKLLPTLAITGFGAAFGGIIIISLVNHIILSLTKSKELK